MKFIFNKFFKIIAVLLLLVLCIISLFLFPSIGAIRVLILIGSIIYASFVLLSRNFRKNLKNLEKKTYLKLSALIYYFILIIIAFMPWKLKNPDYDYFEFWNYDYGLEKYVQDNLIASFIFVIPICMLFLCLFNILRKTYNHVEYGIILIATTSIFLTILWYLVSKLTNLYVFSAITLIVSCICLLYIGYLEIGFNKRKIIVASAHEVNDILTEVSNENPNASIDEISLQFIERIRSKPDVLKRLANAIKVGGIKAIEAYSDHPAVVFALGAYEEWISSAPQENEEEL